MYQKSAIDIFTESHDEVESAMSESDPESMTPYSRRGQIPFNAIPEEVDIGF